MASVSETLGLPGSSRGSNPNNLQNDYDKALSDMLSDTDSLVGKNFLSPRGPDGGFQTFAGLKKVMYAHTKNPQSVGASSEGAYFPIADSPSGIQLELTPKKTVGRLSFTPEAIMAAEKGRAAWDDVRKRSMLGLTATFKRNRNRNAVSGRADVLGVLQSNAPGSGTSAVLTLENRDRSSASASYFNVGLLRDEAGTQENGNFAVGQTLAFVASGSGVNGAAAVKGATAANISSGSSRRNTMTADDSDPQYALVITAIDGSNTAAPTITVQRADGGTFDLFTQGAVAGSFLIPHGSRAGAMHSDPGSQATDFFGIEGGLSYLSNSLYSYILGSAKTAVDGLRAYNSTSVSAPRQLTPQLLALGARSVSKKAGSIGTNVLLTWAQWEQYATVFEGNKRYQPVIGAGGDTMTGSTPEEYKLVTGGHMLTFHPDHFAMPQMVMMVKPSDFQYIQEQSLKFSQLDSASFDKDIKQIVATEYGNVMCDRPMRQAIIDDLIESEFTEAIV